MKYNKIVIGIDQSYKNTGVSVFVDKEMKSISSVHLEALRDNSERRTYLYNRLDKLLQRLTMRSSEIVIIIERIRLMSQGFLSINYIKSMGALNAIIVDVAAKYGIEVYSVDTRAWKSSIIGTSKPKANKLGVAPEKWPTIQFIKSKGWEKKILIPLESKSKKTKGVFVLDGKKYLYNDDAADSACIALYGFIPKQKQKLERER